MSGGGSPGRQDGVRARAEEWLTAVRRTGPGPVLVRGGVFMAGALAQVVAWPDPVITGRAVLALVVVPILPVFAPRSRMVTLVIFAAVLGWLARTTAYSEPITYWRLVVLAGLLYLLHTLAALAAVLPYDAVISPGVLSRWLVRWGIVVLLTAVVAMFTLLIPVYLPGQRYLVASLAGLALMAALAGYLATLVRRR
ncbi:hypothetical protein GCM10023322_61800 [Rugosimonospora acidiphila]|uniref:Uncharacterized protein n=1 Tax=Rugosimonospora acidiphila TaxID=556531 RepID=A0ABP9SH86_9ACTN